MSVSGDAGSAPPRAGRWLPLQFLAALALMVWLLPAVGSWLLTQCGLPPPGSSDLDRAAWTMAVFGAGCLGVGGFALATPVAVPWRPMRPLAVLRVYLPAAVVWLAVTIAYLYAMHAAGEPVQKQGALETSVTLGPHDVRVVPFVLTIVVLAPLAEEIVFRGYLLSMLEGVLARRPALLVTAIAFGLLHGLTYALPLALLGLVFGWLRQRHGSLWPSVLAHTVHNGLTMAVALWAPSLFDLMYPR